jgi:hypothetical protein
MVIAAGIGMSSIAAKDPGISMIDSLRESGETHQYFYSVCQIALRCKRPHHKNNPACKLHCFVRWKFFNSRPSNSD